MSLVAVCRDGLNQPFAIKTCPCAARHTAEVAPAHGRDFVFINFFQLGYIEADTGQGRADSGDIAIVVFSVEKKLRQREPRCDPRFVGMCLPRSFAQPFDDLRLAGGLG